MRFRVERRFDVERDRGSSGSCFQNQRIRSGLQGAGNRDTHKEIATVTIDEDFRNLYCRIGSVNTRAGEILAAHEESYRIDGVSGPPGRRFYFANRRR